MATPEEDKIFTEKALEWWRGRTFEENFISCIKHLGHDHDPGLLSERQIKEIYEKHLDKRDRI
jgi:hypothetical protein